MYAYLRYKIRSSTSWAAVLSVRVLYAHTTCLAIPIGWHGTNVRTNRQGRENGQPLHCVRQTTDTSVMSRNAMKQFSSPNVSETAAAAAPSAAAMVSICFAPDFMCVCVTSLNKRFLAHSVCPSVCSYDRSISDWLTGINIYVRT